ncbi:hypothetical protein BV20DRAFT_1057424 [Pilatotrama ljubarskyi]|nr:hypothetical protein BV20DRAFT_1057424 [Pilatotrama ljubarskyi]
MSANLTGTASAQFGLPSGLTTAVDLGSSLSILLVGTVVSSILIPIGTALMYFTMPKSRGRPQYLMIFASLVLGLGEGGLNVYNQVCAIMKKPVLPAITTTYAFVHLFLPLLTESVLLFRVRTEHPPRRLSWLRWVFLYGPIIVIKLARLVVLVAIAVTWISKTQNLPGAVQGGLDALSAVNRLPTQVKWALQLADTLFMSVLFFTRLRRGQTTRRRASGCTDVEGQSFFVRAKTLFWNAVSSFVFPVLLNLVQFALVLVQNGVLQFPSIFAANNQAGIIGMVFATVWAPGGGGGSHQTSSAHVTATGLKAGAMWGEPTGAVSATSGTTHSSGVLSRMKYTREVSELTMNTMNTLVDDKMDSARHAHPGGVGGVLGGLGGALLGNSMGGAVHGASLANSAGILDKFGGGKFESAWDDLEKGDVNGMLGDVHGGGLGNIEDRIEDVEGTLDEKKSQIAQVATRGIDEEPRVAEQRVESVESRVPDEGNRPGNRASWIMRQPDGQHDTQGQ